MTKTEMWTKVQELIEQDEGMSPATKEALEQLLKPKKGGGGSKHPSYEEDGMTYHWCRLHQRYEPEENMVLDKNGKSKGYCKAINSETSRRRRKITELQLKIADLDEEKDYQEIMALLKEIKAIKASLTDPTTFDYDQDWANYNPNK